MDLKKTEIFQNQTKEINEDILVSKDSEIIQLERSFLKDQKIQKLEIQLRKFEQRQSEIIHKFEQTS